MKNKIVSRLVQRKITTSLLTAVLLFSFSANANVESKISISMGFGMIVLGILSACTSFQNCPYLYNKYEYKTPEEYLSFLENRISNLLFLTEQTNEEQLNSFRQELIEHYEEIISKRGPLSMLFEAGVPHQPWALLREEIEQHIWHLDSYRFDRFFQKNKNEMFNTNVPIYSQALIDRVDGLKTILIKIKKCIQPWPTYQSECSQARQERLLSSTYCFFGAFYCFYYANKLFKMAHNASSY